MAHKRKGKELIFISWINRDGSGVKDVPERLIEHMQEEEFRLLGLSMTNGTYIACEFNCFVVKIKG